MQKLNSQKEPVIEILRLVEKKMTENHVQAILCPGEGTRLYCFSLFFYANENEAKGDAFVEQIGHLTK